MRLIDADKVKQYIQTEGFYCDTDADKEATAGEIDKLFPTAEAIPIEWLEKCKDRYILCCTIIDDIIEEWREQNEG